MKESSSSNDQETCVKSTSTTRTTPEQQHTRSIVDENCEECNKNLTQTGRYIHNYHEHNIPVPIPDMNINSFEVDAVIMKQAQRNE